MLIILINVLLYRLYHLMLPELQILWFIFVRNAILSFYSSLNREYKTTESYEWTMVLRLVRTQFNSLYYS
jgi:hypothetical protein